MFARTTDILLGIRQFSSTLRSQRKSIDHYATLSVPRTATKAQIKSSYYQLSKKYHPDVAKDDASQTKFHAVSEAYAILGDNRKRREYDRSVGSPFHAPQGQHPQATTTRPSGFKHFWPTHPRNHTREGMGSHPHPYAHARTTNFISPPLESQVSSIGSRMDPFSSPSVQRATGHRRSDGASQSSSARTNHQQSDFQGAGPPPWAASGDGRRASGSQADGRPSQDEAAAESGIMRALGASGLIGIIMLVAAIGGHSKRTS